MQRFIFIGCLMTLQIMLCSETKADVLLIESVVASQQSRLPSNGITMAAVENQWGEPISKHQAVGTPPITRWEYSNYSVYFENNRVLSSVHHEPFVSKK